MKYGTWPRISGEVMTAVRRAVTEVLVNHDAEARVEVRVRLQPIPTRHELRVIVESALEDPDELELEDERPVRHEEEDDSTDQLKADQEARFRALEL
jgi:hypothetical protein